MSPFLITSLTMPEMDLDKSIKPQLRYDGDIVCDMEYDNIVVQVVPYWAIRQTKREKQNQN